MTLNLHGFIYYLYRRLITYVRNEASPLLRWINTRHVNKITLKMRHQLNFLNDKTRNISGLVLVQIWLDTLLSKIPKLSIKLHTRQVS